MMRNSWARNVKGMKAMADVLAGIGRERQKNFLQYCQHLIRENFMYRFQSPDLNYMNMDESGFAVKFAPFVNERMYSISWKSWQKQNGILLRM